jgi:hypothetical protein
LEAAFAAGAMPRSGRVDAARVGRAATVVAVQTLVHICRASDGNQDREQAGTEATRLTVTSTDGVSAASVAARTGIAREAARQIAAPNVTIAAAVVAVALIDI